MSEYKNVVYYKLLIVDRRVFGWFTATDWQLVMIQITPVTKVTAMMVCMVILTSSNIVPKHYFIIIIFSNLYCFCL